MRIDACGRSIVLQSLLAFDRITIQQLVFVHRMACSSTRHFRFRAQVFNTSAAAMDLSDIPFDVPVILHSIHKQKNLQNPVGTKMARCLADNRDVYEQLVLRHIDDKLAIQSARNDHFLQVRTNGDCAFDSTRVTEQDLFTLESDSACSLFFVSCFTGNILQCDNERIVKCANKNRLESEAWRIIEPRTSSAATYQLTYQHHVLAGRDRQHLILELAKGGKTPDEIEQIVTRLFDSPTVATSNSTYVFPLDRK